MPAYATIYTNSICFAASFNTLQLNLRSLAMGFCAALPFLGVEGTIGTGGLASVEVFIASTFLLTNSTCDVPVALVTRRKRAKARRPFCRDLFALGAACAWVVGCC